MNGFKKILLAAILCPIVLFCSCDDIFTSNNENLIEAPLMMAEQKEIRNALISSVGADISLEYPKTGTNRSAFLMYDMNADGKNEAIAFYRKNSENLSTNVVHINVLKQQDEKWVSICDAVGEAGSIDRVELGTFGENAKMFIGWDLILDRERILVCYNLEKESLKREFTDSYIEFSVADFWKENRGDELICINYKNNEQKNSKETEQIARLITKGDNGFAELSRTKLDIRVTGYKECVSGYYNKDDIGYFLDGVLDSASVNTQILTVNKKGNIQNPLLSGDKTADDNRHKPSMLTQDINSDGILDVPHPIVMEGYEELTDSEKIYKTVWKNLVGNTLRESNTMYISSLGIRFIIPKSLDGKITVKPEIAQNEIVFLEYNKEGLGASEEIFRIRVSEKEGFELENGYEILKSNDYTTISVKISNPDSSVCPAWQTIYDNTEIV